jgi:hypothetical protein
VEAVKGIEKKTKEKGPNNPGKKRPDMYAKLPQIRDAADSRKPVSIHQRVGQLRPIDWEHGGWICQKKTAAAIHTEIAREVNRLLARVLAECRYYGRTRSGAVWRARGD